MNDRKNPEELEDLIDCLIAVSLITRRMAQDLARLTHHGHEKGEHNHVEDGRTGCCPYRIVGTDKRNV